MASKASISVWACSFLASLGASSLVTSASAQIFNSTPMTTPQTFTTDFEIADVTFDLSPDIVYVESPVPGTSIGALVVLRRLPGACMFASGPGDRVPIAFGAGLPTTALALGSVDLVPGFDAVVAGSVGSSPLAQPIVSVFALLPTGVFGPPVPVIVGSMGYAVIDIQLADVEGDGDLDLFALLDGANAGLPNALSVTFNTAGVLGATVTTPLPGLVTVRSLTTADLNGNGAADVIVLGDGGPLAITELDTLYGNGNGSFTAPTVSFSGLSPTSVTLGDVNADGALDLITGHTLTALNVSGVGISLGTGGSFGPVTGYPSILGERSTGVALADLDGDADPDVIQALQPIAGTGTTPANLAVWANAGNGVLTGANGPVALIVPVPFGASFGIEGIRAADLDGTGGVDLVWHNLLVSMDFATTPCSGDFNGDRFVDANDLANVISSLGGLAGSPGIPAWIDDNANGFIDLMDVVAATAQLGAPCPCP